MLMVTRAMCTGKRKDVPQKQRTWGLGKKILRWEGDALARFQRGCGERTAIKSRNAFVGRCCIANDRGMALLWPRTAPATSRTTRGREQ